MTQSFLKNSFMANSTTGCYNLYTQMLFFFKKTSQTITILLIVTIFSIGYSTKAFAESPSVDLVLEPMSYTIPFYKGKPNLSSQGTAKIVAIPNVVISGQRISSENLNFKWRKDNIVLADLSGKGQSSLTIYGQVPVRDININLQVLDSSGRTVAENNIFLFVGKPKIVFYENDPLLGKLFNKALTNNYYLGDKEEILITAEPYFFDVNSNTSSELKYTWLVNGKETNLDGKVNELLLRQVNKGVSGTATIELGIDNYTRIFQYIKNSFKINFGEKI
jgi:hypothetical protein